jgi:hypothetical protein
MNRTMRREFLKRFLKQLCIIAALSLPVMAARAEMPEIRLAVDGHKLTAEVAYSDADRTRGLMHRRMLPENRGMLFVFPQTTSLSFWMKNTYIPLSIAFIDDTGTIINIADMKPLTTDAHNSAGPARYALEMNRGWFRKHDIGSGAKIEGLDHAPAAR